MRYLRLGVAWLLFVWLLGAGDLAAEARVEKNVVYGMFSGLALLMNVHYPESSKGHGVIAASPFNTGARPGRQRAK